MFKRHFMKCYTAVLFMFLVVMMGCTGSDTSNNEPVETDTLTETDSAVDSSETGQTITNIPSLWDVEVLSDHSEKLQQPADNKIATLSPVQLISALNESNSGISLNFKKISNDTIYVDIPEANYLADQVGSTGAYNYLATVVFNLTELNKIKFVNLSFKGGEHAVPGTYSRDDFKRLR